jgi:hypothetical protein
MEGEGGKEEGEGEVEGGAGRGRERRRGREGRARRDLLREGANVVGGRRVVTGCNISDTNDTVPGHGRGIAILLIRNSQEPK